MLVQALSQLEGIVSSHCAAVELLLDVAQIAVSKCGRDMHESLRNGIVLIKLNYNNQLSLR